MDVKNILEVLEAVKVIACPVKSALKDGLDVTDLGKLLDIVKEHQKIIDAIDSVSDVVEEAKDIDASEAAVIAAKVVEIIKAIKAS